MSKYKNIIKAKDVNTDNSKTVNNENSKLVSITVKVPEGLRRHWQSEAKKAGNTISDDIREALTSKYGES